LAFSKETCDPKNTLENWLVTPCHQLHIYSVSRCGTYQVKPCLPFNKIEFNPLLFLKFASKFQNP
jgi:hypothetical protein